HRDDRHDAAQESRWRNRSAHLLHGLHARRWRTARSKAVDLFIQWRAGFGFSLAAPWRDWTKAGADESGWHDAAAAISTCRQRIHVAESNGSSLHRSSRNWIQQSGAP